jgi:hypothetical protein
MGTTKQAGQAPGRHLERFARGGEGQTGAYPGLLPELTCLPSAAGGVRLPRRPGPPSDGSGLGHGD